MRTREVTNSVSSVLVVHFNHLLWFTLTGVRVLPEFDMPGHMGPAWGVGKNSQFNWPSRSLVHVLLTRMTVQAIYCCCEI